MSSPFGGESPLSSDPQQAHRIVGCCCGYTIEAQEVKQFIIRDNQINILGASSLTIHRPGPEYSTKSESVTLSGEPMIAPENMDISITNEQKETGRGDKFTNKMMEIQDAMRVEIQKLEDKIRNEEKSGVYRSSHDTEKKHIRDVFESLCFCQDAVRIGDMVTKTIPASLKPTWNEVCEDIFASDIVKNSIKLYLDNRYTFLQDKFLPIEVIIYIAGAAIFHQASSALLPETKNMTQEELKESRKRRVRNLERGLGEMLGKLRVC